MVTFKWIDIHKGYNYSLLVCSSKDNDSWVLRNHQLLLGVPVNESKTRHVARVDKC